MATLDTLLPDAHWLITGPGMRVKSNAETGKTPVNTHPARDVVQWREIAGRHLECVTGLCEIGSFPSKITVVYVQDHPTFLELAWPSLSVFFCVGLIPSILLIHWSVP